MIGRLIGTPFGWRFQNESESVICFFSYPEDTGLREPGQLNLD
jgi:hypothetical protein